MTEHEPVMPQLEISQDAQREFQQEVKSLVGRKKSKSPFTIKEYPVTDDGEAKIAQLSYTDGAGLSYSENPEPNRPSASIQVRDTEEVNGSFPYWEILVHTLEGGRLVTHHTQSSLINEKGVLTDPTRAVTSFPKALSLGNAAILEKRLSGEPIDEFRRAEDILGQIKQHKPSMRIKSLLGRLTAAVQPHSAK
jgi:hypothetical protein